MATVDPRAVLLRDFAALFASQLASRLLSFLLNLLIARRLPPGLYGVAAVQFQLLTTVLLAVSRDGVRRAALRGGDEGRDEHAAGARGAPARAGGGPAAGRRALDAASPARGRPRGTGRGSSPSPARRQSGVAEASPSHPATGAAAAEGAAAAGSAAAADAAAADAAAAGEASVVNLAWLAGAFGVPAAAAACVAVVAWKGLPWSDPYAQAVALHGVAAVVELVAEPAYVLAQTRLLFGLRAFAEAAATLARCGLTLALLLRAAAAAPGARTGEGDGGVRVFGWGQLAYALSLAIVYVGYFARRGEAFKLLPRRLRAVGAAGHGAVTAQAGAPPPASPRAAGAALCRSGSPSVRRRAGAAAGPPDDPAAAADGPPVTSAAPAPAGRWVEPARLRLAGAFTVQAAEKLALAEGEKIALVALESAYNQGVYGLVSNLGSLVVRALFQPLEEAAFAAFGQWAAAAGATGTEERTSATVAAEVPVAAASASPAVRRRATRAPSPAQGVSSAPRSPRGRGLSSVGESDSAVPPAALAARAECCAALAALVRVALLLGGCAAALGPAYAYTLLRLLYGLRWADSEAPSVLSAYCIYLLLLALNGITEAFVHASAGPRALAHANVVLAGAAAVHLTLCGVLVTRAGALGLVAANCANMALRIAYSVRFIAGRCHGWPGWSLAAALPSAPVWVALVAAAGLSQFAEGRLVDRTPAGGAFLRSAFAHVAVGAALFAGVAVVVALCERPLWRRLQALAGTRAAGAGPQAAPAARGARAGAARAKAD